jgi:plastocyanin
MRSRKIIPAILAIAAFASGAAAQSMAPVTISLSDYAFAPNALTLNVGAPTRLQFTNSASKGHSFSAPEFFAASQIAADDQAKVRNGTVEVAGGQTVEVTVTPGRAGAYPLNCTHFMHSTMGMHGTIIVQ